MDFLNEILAKLKVLLKGKKRDSGINNMQSPFDSLDGGKKKSNTTKQLAILGGLIFAVIVIVSITMPRTSEDSAGSASQNSNIPISQTSATSNLTGVVPPKLDQNAFDAQVINDLTESNDTVSNNTDIQTNDNNSTENTIYTPAVVQNIPIQNTVTTVTSTPEDEDFDRMKNYLNGIRQAITINDDSFVFNGKYYRSGNTINGYLIQDVSTRAIQFKNDEWQYTLRFYGDEK
jgi:hypothetical protein